VKAVDRCGINLDAGMPLWRTTQDVGVFQNILDTAPRNPCRPRRGRPPSLSVSQVLAKKQYCLFRH
jgi:hypothetical protein